MKKNRFKSWLIKVLRNWLAKLEPYHDVFKVEHVHVPLVTLEANVSLPKKYEISEDKLNHLLMRQLSEDIIKYADIQQYESMDIGVFEEQIVYRATIRVVADKRG
jgi:hypothetical protein